MSENNRLMLIANPVSGKRAVEQALPEVCRILLEEGWIPSVFITGKRGDATEFVGKYGAEFGRIAAMGGDGTMNEVISGIIGSGLYTPFAFIPSGTTNDFAATHHIPFDFAQSARLAATGKVRALDACRFNDNYFMFHGACGFFASVVNSTFQDMKNTLGYFAYILDGMANALSLAPRHARFVIDGKEFEDDFIYGGILSTVSLGGNITSLPPDMVRADDGQFEVMLARAPKDIIELGEVLKEFADRNFSGEYINIYKMSRCTIDSDEDMTWSLDGEPCLGGGHIEVEVLQKRIRFVSSDDDATLGDPE